jgi:hypothetical protein
MVLPLVPTDKGMLHVDHANGACEIGNTGDVAAVYSAPSAARIVLSLAPYRCTPLRNLVRHLHKSRLTS